MAIQAINIKYTKIRTIESLLVSFTFPSTIATRTTNISGRNEGRPGTVLSGGIKTAPNIKKTIKNLFTLAAPLIYLQDWAECHLSRFSKFHATAPLAYPTYFPRRF